jgi:formylglycine-generating enzyme required for sulfatase activity
MIPKPWPIPLGFIALSLLAASLAVSACAPRPTPAPSATATPLPPPAPALGATQTRRADQMTLVYVPAGQFQMGSDLDEGHYARQLCKQTSGALAISVCQPSVFANEQPAHTVTLHDFWIDRTEVTNAMYQRCEAAGACAPPEKPSSYTRPSYYGNSAYAAYPVIWVNWQQAADYCQWAGGRLPTEAEWEYAARGPHSWVFPWGNEFDGARLNYCDASCATGLLDETVDDGYPETAPVGAFPKGVSWCGALDMAGNVREWVADWFAPYTAQPQVDPAGPRSGKSRIPRGGSWLDRPDDVRSANRGENAPDYTRHKVGFRCVVDVTQP